MFATDVVTTIDLPSFRLSLSSSSFYLWNSRIGHVSFSRLNFFSIHRGLWKVTNSQCF